MKNQSPLKKIASWWIAFLCVSLQLQAQNTYTYSSNGTFNAPAGVTSATVSAWGGGGGGGSAIGENSAAAGGGGGGAFASGSATVDPLKSHAVIIGMGGLGAPNTGGNGDDGAASTFDANQVLATGGSGGIGSTLASIGGNGGPGGTAGNSTGSVAKNTAGNGAAGVAASGGGGGGGGAGNGGAGANGGAPAAGAGGSGTAGFSGGTGGAGGNGTTGSDGMAGTIPGGGGGGARRGTNGLDRAGGNGAKGQIIVSFTCPSYSLSSTTGGTYGVGGGAVITLANTTTANLPVGIYTVTYNLGAPNAATGLTATMTVSTAGSGTFTTQVLGSGGTTSVTVTSLSSGNPSACSSAIAASNTVNVSSNDRITVGSNTWGTSAIWSTDGVTGGASVPGVANQVTVSGGHTVTLTANSDAGALKGTGTIVASAASILSVGALNLSTTFSGVLGHGAANLSLTKTGTGTLTLSGSNLYQGATSVSQGTLSLSNANALGSTSGTTVSGGAALNLNGITLNKNISISGTGISATGALTATGTATLSGNLTLTNSSSIGGTGNLTISGVIGAPSTQSLTKVGTGTLTFSGVNTYTGTTTLSAGTLVLGAADVINNASNIIFGGGTLKTGAAAGFNETVGTLTLSTNTSSNIVFGTGSHDLTFTGKGSFNSSSTLTITGWQGGYNGTGGTAGRLFVGGTALTQGELDKIWFSSSSGTYPATQLGSGEIVPIVKACPNVPAEKATPACTSLSPLSSLTVTAGAKYGVSGGCSGNYVTLTGNLIGGDTGTTIYIKAGETFTINGNINSTFLGKIYVQAGGTFNLTGIINAGVIYIYGTLNQSLGSGTASLQGGQIWVGYGGIYNAGTPSGNFQQNNAKLYINGTVNMTVLDQFQGTSLMCLNAPGCLRLNTATASFNTNQSANVGIQSGPGSGAIYYVQTSCPPGNGSFSNSANLQICAPNIPSTSQPCPKFGAATVLYGANCAPASAGCSGVVALPISLTFFDAVWTQEGVKVSWATDGVWDSDYFIIERSKDGIRWETVGTVDAQNVKGDWNYSLSDLNPYKGLNYYKLVEVDIEGKKTPYAIDFVIVENNESTSFAVFPNPTTGELHVNIIGEDVMYQFELWDMTGRKLFGKSLSMGINDLGKVIDGQGLYVARLKIGREYKTVKVVVQ